jgi:hypothetical protein
MAKQKKTEMEGEPGWRSNAPEKAGLAGLISGADAGRGLWAPSYQFGFGAGLQIRGDW